MILPREAQAMGRLPFRIAGFMDDSKLFLNIKLRVLNLQRHCKNNHKCEINNALSGGYMKEKLLYQGFAMKDIILKD